MPSKQIALGSLFKVDFTDAASFETVGLVTGINYPPRTRAQIDAVALADTLDVPELGIEERSEFQIRQFWEPGDTAHEKIDTMFGAKAAHDCQIVTSHSTPVTDEFEAKCVGMEPETLEANGLYSRTLTFVRTGAITRT